MYTRVFAALFGCSLAALGAGIDGVFSNTTSQSLSTQTVNNPSSAIRNLFTTQIVATGPGGQVVFDQTLPLAFADPAVQALLTAATAALNGIGVSSIVGPSLTSNVVTFEGSSVIATETGRQEATYVLDGVVTFGPAIVFVGGGIFCDSFAITPLGVPVPSGCTGGTPFVLGSNDTDVNVRTHIHVTIFQDVITTDTFRTRQVYLLQGQAGATAAIPEPGTLGMLLAAGPVFLAWRRGVRQKSGGMRDHQ